MAIATKQKRNKPLEQQNRHLSPSPKPVDKLIPAKTAQENSGFPWGWVFRWTGIGILLVLMAWAGWTFRAHFQVLLAILGDQDAVSAYLQSFGILGPLVLGLAQLTQVLLAVIPGHVFLVAAGYVYGFLPGFILNLTFVVLSSQLAFALARRAGRPLVERLVRDDLLERWYRIGEKEGFTFFTIAFVLPVFPTDVMNFVAGLSGISSRNFLAANILGRTPSAIILTLIGSHGLELSQTAWFILAAVVITLYISGRIAIGRIERRHRPSESEEGASSSHRPD